MNSINYPNCCTGIIWYNLDYHNLPFNKQRVYEQLKKEKASGNAIVSVMITDKQRDAYQLFKSCGFSFTRTVTKSRHKENKLRLGWFLLENLK